MDPVRAALLLMDFQRAIVGALDQADGLIARARSAADRARRAGTLVGYVRVAFRPADRAAIPPRNKAFAGLPDGMLAEGSPDAEIHPDLAPEEGDLVVTKTRVGAFSTTDLAGRLEARGVETLVLAGVSTSGVVLSTVREAADRDFRLLVLADCCADRDPEVHRVLTERVFPRQADVIGSADLDAALAAVRA